MTLFFLAIFAANIFLRTAASVASIWLCRQNEKSAHLLALPSALPLLHDILAAHVLSSDAPSYLLCYCA